ncbi:TROVE domain-containing protein [Chitinophaga qingshengii]|uniref:TROVE domain-containing protein n=1 Tax=Chitinophaga qingshengii TaxID=1569794 RepID=A0ABR7TJE5_9BACT|nr:TROVE domain-containing protein [Chitinophaga qingshengii]MBC9930616.1 TROVE domain-containing protein [Chitinophaga qingshengii]
MKFNLFTQGTQKVTNHAGGPAYRITPELELYTSVVTASLNDQFYEGTGERLARIRRLMDQNDPAFIARLAVYAREKMYMRSVPMVLAVEMAQRFSGNALVGKTVARVIQRADEITEMLAYYTLANERTRVKKLHKLSKQVQKGLAQAFNHFDEYQFAKYNRKTAITLKDALFLVHPKAKDETQQELFNKIVNNTLSVPYTWETSLSAVGQQSYSSETQKQAAMRQAWEDLILSNQLGYMATMRNLRNLLQNDVGATYIRMVCEHLTNATAVQHSKQLPFRYLAAYRELKGVVHGLTGQLMQALETAVKTSVQHLKGFDANTRVVIACDVSGSMQFPVSPKSKIMGYDIGLMLGMILQHKCQHVISGLFGDTWKTVALPGDSILSNVDAFYRRAGEVGYSTNGYLVLADLIRRHYVADKVMMFTDCQLWNSNNTQDTFAQHWYQYKKIAPNAKLYLFDLQGLGTTPVTLHQKDVYLISGWSDKIFEVMEAIENGQSALAHIHNITL